jgi:hypothetical protein
MKTIKTPMERKKSVRMNGEGDATEDEEACRQDDFEGF